MFTLEKRRLRQDRSLQMFEELSCEREFDCAQTGGRGQCEMKQGDFNSLNSVTARHLRNGRSCLENRAFLLVGVCEQMLGTHHADCKDPIQPQLRPGLRIQPCALPDGRYKTKAFGYISRTSQVWVSSFLPHCR